MLQKGARQRPRKSVRTAQSSSLWVTILKEVLILVPTLEAKREAERIVLTCLGFFPDDATRTSLGRSAVLASPSGLDAAIPTAS